MRFAVSHLERYLDNWIQSFDFLRAVIARCIKRETIRASAENFVLRKQLSATAVRVCLRSGEHSPLSGRFLPFEAHRDVFRGLALRCVQNVSGDAAHE